MPADYYICPGCGEEVEVGSRACETCEPPKPWEKVGDDEQFDYDEFIEEEFGGGKKPRGIHKLWALTALILLIIWLSGYFASS